RLGDDANVVADPASLALLRSRLQDAHPGVVIYALTRLEALDEHAVVHELPDLMRHPAPEVRREAFIRVERLRLRSLRDNVQTQPSAEAVPFVKESALRALGSIADDCSELIQALDESDIHVLRGAMIGLLKYGNEPAARQKMDHLLASPSNADRILAMEILGEVNRPEYYPQLIAACDLPETGIAAGIALASIGTQTLPAIESGFGDLQAPRQRLITLSKALGRIGGTHSQTILLSRMSATDDELRSQILEALSQADYRARDISMVRQAVEAEVEAAAWITAAQVDLHEAGETDLLVAAMQGALAQARSRALLCLSYVLDGDSIRRAREALLAGSPAQMSYALEIMDAQLPADWKGWVMPLLEEIYPQARNQRFAAHFPQARQAPEDRLCAIIENANFPYWLRACAVHALARLNRNLIQGDDAMLSTVEKVLILKTVSMFSQTPDNVLADVADLLEEVDVAGHETIFNQGEAGDSLYVILDGKVRVHDGERLLNYLGERDVFGEMALLDPEPRLASVTAEEPTRLFRLDQASFYELMAQRPEIATGIIRVLTSHLRNRIRDIAQLNQRIQELEKRATA
ncbi:MAG: cyclic nucleotide-binding domain-containing protein, partial [Bacteroidota bacterium]